MLSFQDTPTKRLDDGALAGAWWAPSDDPQRIDCLLCPRKCRLKPGDKGFCFVRENRDGEIALTTYGKSTGFCIDPIEKKPLNHFFPGTPVLSFGTAGCNLGCKFCQNWDISKSREVERLSARAEPETIARAAAETGCASVAYTYNDPVIWAEYAIDTAKACHAVNVKNVAVTAGYITAEARPEFFQYMDAANVDLKAFSEDFYQKITYSRLEPVLETLSYLKHETSVWFELTNLIIPGENDNPDDLRRMCNWIVTAIGEDVPIHFTAFHPDFRMMDKSRTSPEVLNAAREIALTEGVRYAYVGNVHDRARQSTYCHGCGGLVIERDWYELGQYNIDVAGHCTACQTAIPGRFGQSKGDWGSRRQPLRIEQFSERVYLPQATNSPNKTPQNTTPENTTKDVTLTSANRETMTTPPTPSATAPIAQMLDLEQLNDDQKNAALKAAANWTTQAVLGEQLAAQQDSLETLANSIVMGAFVTLKRGEILRGCCGVLGKPMQVGAALVAASAKTANEDQRMAAISPTELSHLDIEVTLLGPFNRIEAEGAARRDAIEIGKHGLMIQRGNKSGLLLPSVAVERGWDATQFLQGVCNKAGLPIAAWEASDTTVFTFDGSSVGGKLADLIPINLDQVRQPPMTKEQLAEYAKIAGQNIVALVTGGTPSYVIPQLPDATVNAIVLSMQWSTGEDGASLQQGSALQASFRPGVAFQSTLYQMCQRAAFMFQQQRFSGQLQIGLSLGYDPSLHGFGNSADLEGVDATQRGIIISDARHCAFAYNPEKSITELRDGLREILPIGSRDAAIHTMNVLSTMPHVTSISAPNAVAGTGIRPPAVAGKFYPAEDAARRAMVGTFFKDEEPAKSSPLAVMVPHAGIKFSGRVAARVWRSLEEPESRPMIIISPKHTANGVNWSVCPFGSWRLSQTTSIAGDAEFAKQIAEAVTPLQLDASAHQEEHGIEVQLPFLERVAPECKVVGLALNGGSWEDIQAAAAEFAGFLKSLEQMPLLVISSDMNHYAPDEENRRRDRMALDAMATCDPQHLINTCRENDISMCGLAPAAFVMETLKQMGCNFQVTEVDYATSGEVSGDRSQVVGYAGALLEAV